MSERSTHAGIEEQLWPIACSTAVLMGVLTVVVWEVSDFDDERLLLNGYTHLAAVAVFGAAIIYLGSKIKGTARRTAELAILFSLALHAIGGLSAVYLFGSPLSAPGSRGTMIAAAAESDEESPPPTDYHWGQNDDEQEGQQAFEKPLDTMVHDQTAPAATVQPRDLERPTPAAEVPRAAKQDLTPLGIAAAAEPGKPLDVRRPDASKVEDLPPPDALAMLRQKGQEPDIPDGRAQRRPPRRKPPRNPPGRSSHAACKPRRPTNTVGRGWPSGASIRTTRPRRRRPTGTKSRRPTYCLRRRSSRVCLHKRRRSVLRPMRARKRRTRYRNKAARLPEAIEARGCLRRL